MQLSEIKNILNQVSENYQTRNVKDIFDNLSILKKNAVEKNEEGLAKEIWCFEEILKLQEHYITAFLNLKDKKYYEAWCEFEQAEIRYIFLKKHFQETYKYKVYFIVHYVRKYYKLFPYTIFSSIEFIKREVRCGICDQLIELRNSCGHKVGEIYKGEMCNRIVKKWDLIGYSLVKNPLNKYTVMFEVDENDNKVDNYDYTHVKYLADRLTSPFHGWNFKVQRKRLPHENFKKVKPTANCPCESNKLYKNCCLKESGVLSPEHLVFTFEEDIPEHLKSIVFTDSFKKRHFKTKPTLNSKNSSKQTPNDNLISRM